MRRLIALCSLLALAACATSGEAPVLAEAPGAEPALGSIPPGGLEKGTCGALLWTRSVAGEPQLIFRSNAAEGAEVRYRGAMVALELVEARGRSVFGQQLEQTFRPVADDAPAISVHVLTETGAPFDGGVYTRAARITLTRDDGWEVVTPVVGVMGCAA